MGEAVLSLSVDWWKDRFAVDLQSSPQGLPDLLCVCNDIPKVPDGWTALGAPSNPSLQPVLEPGQQYAGESWAWWDTPGILALGG